MSHIALQRVVVRMLFDPAFARAVYSDVNGALPEEDLSTDEKSWLIQSDPRAYRVDPFRRGRSLHALLEEYPCSSALITQEKQGSIFLNAFFSSRIFHECIQQRGSLAQSFGNYLLKAQLANSRARAIANLEQTIATLRRSASDPSPTGEQNRLLLSPHYTIVDIPQGSMALHGVIWERLMQTDKNPVVALVEGSPNLEGLPPLNEDTSESLLLHINEAGEVNVETLSTALFQLLDAARRPTEQSELLAHLCTSGLSETESIAVLNEVIEDGLLIQV